MCEEEDEMIWQFTSSGVYSSQSLYKIINFRGIKPVHVPALRHIKVPPRVYFFLWLLTNNWRSTRDNLAKRRKVDDPNCLFCLEPEYIQHLFIDCVVVKQCWKVISGIVGTNHYRRRVLCRVLHSAKSCRHIPSRQRLLYRMSHVGHSTKDFPSAMTALGKEKPPWWPGHGDGPFAECHASALGKEMCFLFFFKKMLCRVPASGTRQSLFPFFGFSLPSALPMTLGKAGKLSVPDS